MSDDRRGGDKAQPKRASAVAASDKTRRASVPWERETAGHRRAANGSASIVLWLASRRVECPDPACNNRLFPRKKESAKTKERALAARQDEGGRFRKPQAERMRASKKQNTAEQRAV